MLSKWPWISRCGDYWQQAELRTDGACRIMMMMKMVYQLFVPVDQGRQPKKWMDNVKQACSKNGKRTAVSKSITLQLYQWEKKPRKTTEEIDRQCKRRYGSKDVDCTTSNGSGVGQKQMETSSSSLIIIEVMEESRRRIPEEGGYFA